MKGVLHRRSKLIQCFVLILEVNTFTDTKPTKMNFTIMDFPRSTLFNNVFIILIGLINAEIYVKGKNIQKRHIQLHEEVSYNAGNNISQGYRAKYSTGKIHLL